MVTSTCSIGIAKPTPMLPPWSELTWDPSEAIAEFTPTTWPCRLTSGPPELPGLIAASVCTALMKELSPRTLTRGDRPVDGADDAGGHRRGQPQRRADGHHRLADAHLVRGADRGRLEVLGLRHVEHRDVVDGAAPDDVGLHVVAVLVDDVDRTVVLVGLGDHVVVGDDVPLGVEHEPRAGGALVLAVVLRHDLDRARAAPSSRPRRCCRCRPEGEPPCAAATLRTPPGPSPLCATQRRSDGAAGRGRGPARRRRPSAASTRAHGRWAGAAAARAGGRARRGTSGRGRPAAGRDWGAAPPPGGRTHRSRARSAHRGRTGSRPLS